MDETAATATPRRAAFDRRTPACRPRTLRPVDRGGRRKTASRPQGHRGARSRPFRRARRVGVRARPPAPLRGLRRRARRRTRQHATPRASARPPPPDLTQIPHAERRADPRRLVTPLVGLGCAAVLLVAIWWVLAGSRSGQCRTAHRRCRRRWFSPAIRRQREPGCRCSDARHAGVQHARQSGQQRLPAPRPAPAAASTRRQPKREENRARARDAPEARSHQRQLGRGLRFARRDACSTTWPAPAACRA